MTLGMIQLSKESRKGKGQAGVVSKGHQGRAQQVTTAHSNVTATRDRSDPSLSACQEPTAQRFAKAIHHERDLLDPALHAPPGTFLF